MKKSILLSVLFISLTYSNALADIFRAYKDGELLLCSDYLADDEIVTLKNGKRIIINKNGTWDCIPSSKPAEGGDSEAISIFDYDLSDAPPPKPKKI